MKANIYTPKRGRAVPVGFEEVIILSSLGGEVLYEGLTGISRVLTEEDFWNTYKFSYTEDGAFEIVKGQ